MKVYYYFFYKLYNFWELISFPTFWSDFKAIVTLLLLEIWLLFSVFNYYSIYNNSKFEVKVSSPILFIPLVLIICSKVYFFVIDTKWKSYHLEFNKMTKSKNILLGSIVWIIIILITISFFLSTYYMHDFFKTN